MRVKLLVAVMIVSLLTIAMSTPALARDEITLDPIVPAIASFIIPGAGQLLNDQPDKAITHFAVAVGINALNYFLVYSVYTSSPAYSPYLGGTLHLAWSAYSAFDAYEVAEDRRRGIRFSSLEMESSPYADEELSLASQLDYAHTGRDYESWAW